MKVKCTNNHLAKITNADVFERLSSSIHLPDPDSNLELGAEYSVQAIELMWGGIWIYLETCGSDYPYPYPIEFFEIVDSSILVDWSVRAPYRNQNLAIVGFQEWISDPNFYEKLLDDSPVEVAIYELRKL